MADAHDLRSIFWQTLPVSLRRGDTEEYLQELNVRVLLGRGASGQAIKVLKLYVTKEDDASFLYSLEVAEDRYPRIKEEEQLLVDFAGFVDKVVWLFEQCRAQRDDGNDTAQQDHPRSESAPVATKFRAVLQVGGAGAGCMRLVERNAFKELPHLTLHTKAGTDASLKQFLAFRMAELKRECSQLSQDLDAAVKTHAHLKHELEACKQSAATAAVQAAVAARHQDAASQALKEELQKATTRGNALESQVSALSAACAAAETRAAEAEAAVARLNHSKSDVEVELAECLSRLRCAEERADGAEAAAAQAAQRSAGFEAALRQAETRVQEWQAVAAANELRGKEAAGEAARWREAAEAAMKEANEQKVQLEGKCGAVEVLEGELEAAKRAALEAQQAQRDLQGKLEKLEAALDAVQKEAAAAAANAEETSKKNQANEKMIVWLNKQLTAAQLSGGSTSKARIPAVPPYGANLGQTGPMPAVPMAGTFLRPRHPGPVPSALYDSRHGTYVTPAGELSKASLSSAASSGATDDDWVPRSFAASWPGEGAHAAAQAQRAQDAKGHAAISPASVLPKHAAG